MIAYIHFAEDEQVQRYELLKARLENYINECMKTDIN